MDPKSEIQSKLKEFAARCPIAVYTHRNGGQYVVFGHSVDEATLTPLVHYYSIDHGTRWTRTVENFTQRVDGHPRFEPHGDVMELLLHIARSSL